MYRKLRPVGLPCETFSPPNFVVPLQVAISIFLPFVIGRSITFNMLFENTELSHIIASNKDIDTYRIVRFIGNIYTCVPDSQNSLSRSLYVLMGIADTKRIIRRTPTANQTNRLCSKDIGTFHSLQGPCRFAHSYIRYSNRTRKMRSVQHLRKDISPVIP